MNGLMIFFLVTTAASFWIWVAGTVFAGIGSIFSDKIRLGYISGKLFSPFILSLICLAVTAFIAKSGGV